MESDDTVLFCCHKFILILWMLLTLFYFATPKSFMIILGSHSSRWQCVALHNYCPSSRHVLLQRKVIALLCSTSVPGKWQNSDPREIGNSCFLRLIRVAKHALTPWKAAVVHSGRSLSSTQCQRHAGLPPATSDLLSKAVGARSKFGAGACFNGLTRPWFYGVCMLTILPRSA